MRPFFTVCLVICTVTSLRLSAAPSGENIDDLTFSGGYAEPESGTLWYADFRVQAAVVVILTAVILIAFW